MLTNYLRYLPLTIVLLLAASGIWLSTTGSLPWLWLAIPAAVIALLGLYDLFHPTNNLLRIYPLLAYGRFMSEEIRPEVHQYFVESDTDGTPISRNDRQMVYERADSNHSEKAFGTELDVYEAGYEWLNHSIAPRDRKDEPFRVCVGGKSCKQPYQMALLNVSSMSFGSLSANAILALNGGARLGGFAHSTGEGGLSEYHLRPGGDLVWEIGTAYFGCRTKEGKFDPQQFEEKANKKSVKCVTVKLSQGAKPGLGGVMPAAKMTDEIAKVRGVPAGKKCVSPPGHSEFSTPIGLVEFIQRLREMCGGKPVGFKLCIGRRSEFLGICKAMMQTQILPDYIVVDGGEGGTGAAPLTYEDHVGFPLTEGLHFVHHALVACDLRDEIKIGCSGKVTSPFEMVRRMIQGADYCNAARAMMLSLGCIQAQRCQTNTCPTGVTTQDPTRMRGLKPEVKQHRVRNFQHSTVMEFNQMIASMGLESPDQLRGDMLMRRIDPTTVRSYEQIYYQAKPGELIRGEINDFWAADWKRSSAESFLGDVDSHKAAIKSANA